MNLLRNIYHNFNKNNYYIIDIDLRNSSASISNKDTKSTKLLLAILSDLCGVVGEIFSNRDSVENQTLKNHLYNLSTSVTFFHSIRTTSISLKKIK